MARKPSTSRIGRRPRKPGTRRETQSPSVESAAKKAPAKKAAAKQPAAKKAPAKKAPTKKAAAKQPAAKQAPAKQAPARKAAAKQPAAKKAPARKTPAKTAQRSDATGREGTGLEAEKGRLSRSPGARIEMDGPVEIERLVPAEIADRIATIQPELFAQRPTLENTDWKLGGGGQKLQSDLAEARKAIDGLRPNIPLLLMPLRLETRFSGRMLRIRIFPDQIALDGLERRLTDDEVAAGKEFLEQYRNAAEDDKAALWAGFAGASDPWRSAWIVRCLRNGKYKTREKGEAEAPAFAPLLPERWIVAGRSGNNSFHGVGSPIPEDLAFSPDLSAEFDENSDLAVDPAVKWMFDFAEATKKGMALALTLPNDAQDHIEELLVTGIVTRERDKDAPLRPKRAGKLFDQLLEAQMYDWGAGFVQTGTATNNTSEVKSAWLAAKPDLEALRLRELEDRGEALSMPELADDGDEALRPVGPLASGDSPDTAYALATRALGLAPDGALRRFEHRQSNERAAARAMNRLLWPVTLGELFGTLLSGPDTNSITGETIEYLREAFCEDLTGGSPLPAIRSGNTPYGLLPVESFTRRREVNHSDPEAKKRQQFSIQLRGLLPEWQAATPKLLRMAERPTGMLGYDEPGERLKGLLQQDPNPAKFHAGGARNMRGWAQFLYALGEAQVHPKHDTNLLKTVFQDHRFASIRIVRESGNPFSPEFSLEANIPVHVLLLNLWANAGFTDYLDWPEKFRDRDHQIEVLQDKIDLLDMTSRVDSGMYGHQLPINYMNQQWVWKESHSGALADTKQYFSLFHGSMDQQMRDAKKVLKAMLELVRDHARDNAKFEQAVEPSSDLYKGIVGDQDIDPRLTWLAFEELVEWPANQLVEVSAGPQTVPLATYMEELAAYAQCFIDNTAPPDLTSFPNNRKPMLYQLLRSSIYRTATDADPVSSAVNAALDLSATATADDAVLESARIGETLRRAKAVGSRGSASRTAEPELAMTRTLAARSPTELRRLSGKLKADARREAKNKDYPAADAKALAAELDRIAKLPAGELTKTIPKAPRSTRAMRLRQLKAAVELIGQLNPEQAALLMRQTLGLASWRLDAWFTAITSARLQALREDGAATQEGLQVGAFGWVEDLRRNPENSDEAHSTRSQGFIHTPSLPHAKAAAILRSGWNAYGSKEQDSPLAVDLSSERMRFAQWAFDAIRNGQDPGDLFGREFERALRHGEDAPEWIWPIRQAVLELDKAKADPNLPVVDGIDLQRLWTEKYDKLEAAAREHLRTVAGNKKASFSPVVNAVKVMEDRIDAMADAGLADAMFSLVQGNPDRAGAQLSAISDGLRSPADLQFLDTTPQAITQIHRMVLLAPAPGDLSASWIDPSAGGCALATADPDAEALAAALIGSPKGLMFRFVVDKSDGSKLAEGKLSWEDLIANGSPFGGGALAALRALPADGWSDECPIALRLKGFLLGRSPEFARADLIALAPEAETETALGRWGAWRAVISGSRALHPRDCGEVESGGEASLDLGGLEQRANDAETQFRLAAKAVLRLLPEPIEGDAEPVGTADVEKLRDRLTALVATGWDKAVKAALPDNAAPEEIYARIWSLAPALRETLTQLGEVRPAIGDEDADVDSSVRAARTRLRAIFGPAMRGITRFIPADRAGVEQALARASDRKDPPGSAHGWLEKMAYVREPLRRVNDALVLSECDAQADVPEPMIAQWPNGAEAPWIALGKPMGREGPSSSWLFLRVGEADTQTGTVAGLVVDEVIDKIPASSAHTGAAMHFDAPTCEAPQAMLLALPPEDEKWSHEVLLDTLKDCFAMARMRAVDSTVMDDFNAVLPAIFGDSGLSPGGDDGAQ